MEMIYDSKRCRLNYVDSEGIDRTSTVTEFFNTLIATKDKFQIRLQRIDGKIHIFVEERPVKQSFTQPKNSPEHVNSHKYNPTARQITVF